MEKQAQAKPSLDEALAYLRDCLAADSRAGVRKLLLRFERKAALRTKESKRMEALWAYENKARAAGASRIAGIDEAGRGPLVGPVLAAAVILPENADLPGLDDSKKLTAQTRERLYDAIRACALAVGVGQASASEIDTHNIYRASQMAMEMAVEALPVKPDHLLLDAMRLPRFSEIPQDKIIHGDALSASIAAASIVAKVTRDRMLVELDREYPLYGFAKHKGYGTAEHLEALRVHGACPEHRRSFGPVAAVLGGVPQEAGFDYWAAEIEKAGNSEVLSAVGKQIRVIGRKKMEPNEVQKLRESYRRKRDQLAK